MTKSEVNKKIAILLGFKPYRIKTNGKENAVFAWAYPREYADQVCSSPEYDIPDFVGVLKEAMDFGSAIFMSSNLTRDYGTKLCESDLKEGEEE